MKKIDRHIRSTVLLAMLVVIALVGSVNLVFALADELADAEDAYTMGQAFLYVLQTTPTSVYELLPFSALGGALIGLGILASHNELVVIQAAGVKTWRILWAVVKPTMVIMLLSLLLGEYVSPLLEQRAQSNKALLKSGGVAINSDLGTWRKFDNEFIHINAIAPGGELLYGVTRYRMNEQRRLISSSFADTAEFGIADDGNSFWRLRNVEKTLFLEGRTSVQSYLEEDWIVDLSPQLLSVLLVEPDRQSISGLYQVARFFQDQGLDADDYYLAFWKKILQPISTLALVLLAVAFVFGPLREATMGYRVFIAISVGLVFTILQRMMEPASLLYGFHPLVAVLVPIILCAFIGFYFMARVR